MLGVGEIGGYLLEHVCFGLLVACGASYGGWLCLNALLRHQIVWATHPCDILGWLWPEDTLAERLRRRPAKPMGSPRVGSNPTGVAFPSPTLVWV